MKRFQCILAGLCLLVLSTATTQAQSYRLTELADRLAANAEELAERAYSDYRNNNFFGSRSDMETLYLAQQFNASAALFRRMVNDRRREAELREAAVILSDLARRADRNYSQRSRWSDVQRSLSELQRELNVGGSFPGGGGGRQDDGDETRVTGRLRWRGTVDDEIQLVISNDRVEVRTIGGNEYNNATYNFTSPLPNRRVNVSVNKLKGRGDVRVLQQPSRNNNFTTVVQIRDSKGEARDYEIEVIW